MTCRKMSKGLHYRHQFSLEVLKCEVLFSVVDDEPRPGNLLSVSDILEYRCSHQHNI